MSNSSSFLSVVYKTYASVLCALLVLLLCFEAVPRHVGRGLIKTTVNRFQVTNITEYIPNHSVDVPKETKALVVSARSHDDLQWMKDVQSDWIQYPYLVTEDTNPNSTLSVPANKGNEAMRYLSFIIDNFESLPDIIAFRHGHESAWHQSFDSAAEVNNLNLTTVHLRRYQSFNCDALSFGCQQHLYLADKQRAETASNGETKKLLSTRSSNEVDAAIYEVWDSWFGVPMPHDIASVCCAQFVVLKAAVYRWPRKKYLEFRQWLLTTNLTNTHSGEVFERLWHVIFGTPSVQCETEDRCYCNVYTGSLSRACPP